MKSLLVIGGLVGSSLMSPVGGLAQPDSSGKSSELGETCNLSAEHILQKATAYWAHGHWPQALAYVERYLVAEPGDCNARYLKLTILLAMEQWSDAADTAAQLLAQPETLLPDWMTDICRALAAANRSLPTNTYFLLSAIATS